MMMMQRVRGLLPHTKIACGGILARQISKKKNRLQKISPMFSIEQVDELPSSLPHEIDFGNKLFQVKSKLITSTNNPEDLPEWKIPEVAFAGRSNVGKSSIINAMLGQPGLVRTSKTPGRTQELNFFSVGGKVGSLPAMSLVDMPGYGFANAPKEKVDEWHRLVGGYIENRRGSNLKITFLLIDSRRGIGAVDEDFMDFMHDLGTIYQVVFTKADTVSEAKLRENITIAQEIGGRYDRLCMNPIIHVCSSKENFGIKELQRQVIYCSGLLQSKQKR